jgi:ATP-dependent helicase/DNAse subunit B
MTTERSLDASGKTSNLEEVALTEDKVIYYFVSSTSRMPSFDLHVSPLSSKTRKMSRYQRHHSIVHFAVTVEDNSREILNRYESFVIFG